MIRNQSQNKNKQQRVGQLKTVIGRDGSRWVKLTDIIRPGRITSIVGAGGKTSTMYTLGCELAAEGEQVVMTTTTRILPFGNEFPDNLRLVAEASEEGKLKGLAGPDGIEADRILIEADGSRGLPVKMPADHEPVITPKTDTVIAVLGLSGIGKPIKDVCHRTEYITRHLNKGDTEILTTDDAIKIIMSDEGLYKNVSGRNFYLVLNQADSEKEIALALEIAGKLPENIQCIITAYEDID